MEKSIKSIKYIYYKKKLKKSTEKNNSLCFISQGLDSKQFYRLKSCMNKIDLNFSKSTKKSWNKFFGKKNDLVYGDLYILESKKHMKEPWLFYTYNHIINYLSYRQFNREFQYNIKGMNLSIDSIFPLQSKENSINEFMKLGQSSLKEDFFKDKFIYPWENISSNEIQPIVENQKKVQVEENYANLIDEWFEKDGFPIKVLMSYIIKNNIQFIGSINSSSCGNSFVRFDNYLLYEGNNLNFKQKFGLKNSVIHSSKNFFDNHLIKIAPLNGNFIAYL